MTSLTTDIAADIPGGREAAPSRRGKPSRATLRRRKASEFRLYYAATFPIFLLVAIAARALPHRWRPFGAERRSVFGDAKAAAYTVLPFVFMG